MTIFKELARHVLLSYLMQPPTEQIPNPARDRKTLLSRLTVIFSTWWFLLLFSIFNILRIAGTPIPHEFVPLLLGALVLLCLPWLFMRLWDGKDDFFRQMEEEVGRVRPEDMEKEYKKHHNVFIGVQTSLGMLMGLTLAIAVLLSR